MKRFSFMLILAPLFCRAQLLTLEEAVALAVKDNRSLQVSSLEIAKAGEVVAQARTRRLPQFNAYVLAGQTLTPIDFSIPKGALGVYPSTGPIPSQNANITTPRTFNGMINLSAAQPLTQLKKVALAVRQARVGEELAQEGARQQKQETAHRVREAYYQIVQTQTQLASARESLKYLTELSALVARNLAEQTVLKSELLAVKARISQHRYQLLVLENSIATQKEALNRLLGRDLAIDFTVEDQPAPTTEEIDVEAARRTAAEQRSEVRRAGLQVKKTELDIQRQRAEYLPDLSVQLSYVSLPNISFVPRNILSAGLLLQWQPFDWGLKKHKIQELKSTSRQGALTAEDARQQVILDVNSKYRKLLETRALLDTQAAIQETEREKLRVLTNQFEQKAALLADLLQQQAGVAQADNQYRQALAGFWSAKAAFDHALGKE